MKRAILSTVVLSALGILLASCGGSSSSTSGKVSGFSTRAFVSNSFSGILNIIDYSHDIESTNAYIAAGTQPGMMVLTPDRKTTMVFDGSANAIDIVDNSTETTATSVSINAPASSIVVSPDSKTAYIATPGLPISGQANGAVQVLTIASATMGTPISVPNAKTLALSPDGTKMLVFSDGSDQATYLDLTTLTASTPTNPVPVMVGGAIVRPVAAAFSSDGTKAYVANCGAECGGAPNTAGVSVVDMSTNPPAAGAELPVNAATTMLLDGSNLYVAGTVPQATAGSLTVLAASGSTVSVSKPAINIGLGFHTKMIKGADNTLFIGATGCPNVVVANPDPQNGVVGGGCLTIYNTSSADAVITNAASGFVTGMAAIPRRSVVYVTEGGELDIYDTQTRALQNSHCPGFACFIDIVGKAQDVVVVDQ